MGARASGGLRRGVLAPSGRGRAGGPFARADARLVLALLVIGALVVVAWIGLERRRPAEPDAAPPVPPGVVAEARPPAGP